jgi:Protein of unknown function (DUF3102)
MRDEAAQAIRETEAAAPESITKSLADHAAAIRTLGKRVVGDIVEIGRRLAECKRIAGHGNWLSWLEREFGWNTKTAERFMRVHELSDKFDNLSNLDIGVSSL